MNILVIFKQLLKEDYEEEYKKAGYLQQSDKNVLLEALEIRDKVGGKITGIIAGTHHEKMVLQDALALGIDEAVLIRDDTLDVCHGRKAASLIAKTIKQLERFDMILCGRQAVDGDGARICTYISRELNIPQILYSKELKVKNNMVEVTRFTEYGDYIVQAPMPLLVMSMKDNSPIRHPNISDILKAYKGISEIKEINWGDDYLKENQGAFIKILEREVKDKKIKELIWIEGSTEKEKAECLLQRINKLNYGI